MSHPKIRLPITALIAAVVFAGGQPVSAQAKDAKPMLRLICSSGLSEEHMIILAARNEAGEWEELAEAELRSSMVSDWLPARTGELHIAVREEGALTSIGHFTYPAGARRALVALTADKESETYGAYAIDPEKEGFTKATTLIINLSPHPATVSLGVDKLTVEAGQHLIAKPVPDGNGGYRTMVSYPEAEGAAKLCYDRQTMANPNSRRMLFLLPDRTLGLRVVSLPMFGNLD